MSHASNSVICDPLNLGRLSSVASVIRDLICPSGVAFYRLHCPSRLETPICTNSKHWNLLRCVSTSHSGQGIFSTELLLRALLVFILDEKPLFADLTDEAARASILPACAGGSTADGEVRVGCTLRRTDLDSDIKIPNIRQLVQG
jgi:hypothetical protein